MSSWQALPTYRPFGPVSATPPAGPSNGNVWMDSGTQIVYVFDAVRNKWLSISRHMYFFSRNGNANGAFIKAADTNDIGAGWSVAYNGVLTGIHIRSTDGLDTKSFQIIEYNTTETLLDVAYPGGGILSYTNIGLNIDVSTLDVLQCYTPAEADNTVDVIIQLGIAWRVDPI